MEREEMTKIAIDNGWANGPVADEMWKAVERTYMECTMSKKRMTYIYWRLTGLYETLESDVKNYIACRDELKKAIDRGDAWWSIGGLTCRLEDAIKRLANTDQLCKTVCDKANIK